jgi:transposase
MEIITGEPRRRRTEAEKLEVLASAEALGSVSKAARLHGISVSMVFLWRKQFRSGALKAQAQAPMPAFAPVALIADVPMATAPSETPPSLPAAPSLPISITLGSRIEMRVPVDSDPALAAAIAKALAPFAADGQ